MVLLTLTPDMIDLLRALKSARFISYECAKIYNNAYGNLRINTDQGAIELTNLERTMPFFGDEEELSCFECAVTDPSAPFQPYLDEPAVTYPVDEKIVGVELIRDHICINGGEYEFLFDQAVVLRTETKTVMFSRHVWFSEDIAISDHDDYAALFSTEAVIDTLSNEGDYDVRVTRTVEKL